MKWIFIFLLVIAGIKLYFLGSELITNVQFLEESQKKQHNEIERLRKQSTEYQIGLIACFNGIPINIGVDEKYRWIRCVPQEVNQWRLKRENTTR